MQANAAAAALDGLMAMATRRTTAKALRVSVFLNSTVEHALYPSLCVGTTRDRVYARRVLLYTYLASIECCAIACSAMAK